MSNTPDGGPAFPHERQQIQHGTDGMSLRDYFAAKALPAIVAEFMEDGSASDSYDDVADGAYLIADAMIRRREQQPAQSPAEKMREHLDTFGGSK